MELRQLQLETTEMMGNVHEVLASNQIRHYLLGGSALGAVRHKGFIPWDDDMDIGVFRKDFEKTEQLLSDMGEQYVYEHAEKHIIPDAPIGHIRLKVDNHSLDQLPTIDIFALDRIPDNRILEKIQRICATAYHLCVLRRPSENRGKVNRIISKVITSLPDCILDGIQRILYTVIVHWNKKETKRIGNLFGYWTTKETVDKACFGEPELLPFENLVLPVPSKPDEYLRSLYGDYMQLPPEEERVSHHTQGQTLY